MSVVFLKLFNMSITACWVILFVLLCRILLKKAPKWTKCLLWGFVGLRLVFPFSIESILSLIPSAEFVPQELIHSNSSVNVSGSEIFNYVGNNPVSYDLGISNGSLVFTEITAPDGNYVNPLLIITFIASIVWIIGLVVMLIYGIVSYLTLFLKVRASIVHKENIYLCDNIDSPFILGIIKPKIYMPSGFSDEQMEYIVAHEKAHLKRKDHWWKPIGFALLSVYWFNPIIWLAYTLLCRDIELACDEKVIRDMENADIKGYSETLVNCSSMRRKVLVCPLAFGEISVKGRVKAMLKYKKPAFWVVAVAVTSCVIIVACFLTNPQKNESASVPTIPSDTVENSTNETTTSNENSVVDENETENTTNSANKNEPTTQEPDTTVDKNNTSSKIKYVTDGSLMLQVDGINMFGPQYSYIAVTSPKLKNKAYFKNSVINYYSVPTYFDSSVTDANAMNKSIEIQKEFYWINKKMNSLGLKTGNISWSVDSSLNANESTAYDQYLARYAAMEKMLIPALVENGTLKISESDRNKVIRDGCSSTSYITFEYPIDLPQEIVDEEIAFIRSYFGTNGINSNKKLQEAYNIIDQRQQAIADKMGYGSHYNPIYYTVSYYQDEWYEPGTGVDKSLYNVVKETHTTKNDKKSFFIMINYDPVDHLNLDEANAKEVLIDSARPKYIAYKKNGIDQLSVTLNKDNYIRQISHYR